MRTQTYKMIKEEQLWLAWDWGTGDATILPSSMAFEAPLWNPRAGYHQFHWQTARRKEICILDSTGYKFFGKLYDKNPRLTNIIFLKTLFIYLFLDRGWGKEKERKRNISVWLPLQCPQMETWLATQKCAPTRNQTSNPLAGSQSTKPHQPGQQIQSSESIFFWLSCLLRLLPRFWLPGPWNPSLLCPDTVVIAEESHWFWLTNLWRCMAVFFFPKCFKLLSVLKTHIWEE